MDSSSQVHSSLLVRVHLRVVHGVEIDLPALRRVYEANSTCSTSHWQAHGARVVGLGVETTVVELPVVEVCWVVVDVPVLLVVVVAAVVCGQQT